MGAARGAVEEPATETAAHAEEGVVAELRAQAAPSPDIEELCERIREIIRSKRPPDEESLVDAEPEQMAREAGGQLNDSVQGDTEHVAGHYDSMETPPAGAPATTPTAIVDPAATVEAAPLDAQRATPDPVAPEAVSLDADVAANQARMDEAGMSSPAAQIVAEQSGDRSNPVVQAHEAQGELQETAAQDPAEVLRAQEEAISSARGDMSALQERVAAALSQSRIATVASTRGQQDGAVESEAEKRDRVGREAQAVFDETQRTVLEMMDAVPDTAMRMWDSGKERLAHAFRQRLDSVRRWINDRHSGVGGFFVGLADAVTGLPGWVTREYDAAELEFSNGICDLARDISREVNTVVAGAEALIRSADERISRLFTDLGPELDGWAEEQRAQFQARLTGLTDTVHQRRDDFNRDLRRRAAETVDEVRTEIHELRQAARGLVGRIADAIQQFVDDPARFIINGLLRILGIAPVRFWRLIRRIEQVVIDIIDDPQTFANNLLAAVGQGFSQFFDHVGTHLLNGLLRWLFQGLGSVGVEIPRDISLRSAITFFLQLMGISWPRIRQLIARHVGEQNVALVEQVYGLVSTLIERGPEGIFEMIQQQLNPQTILDTILNAAIEYLTQALITRVTARIVLMFNPAGAVIQAIEAIYRVLRWIFENAERIFSLVETVVNGLADIVAGNIGGMANAVEMALAGLIPAVIDFLADYMGLGGLPNAVADAVRGLQEMVEQRLDAAIGFLVTRGRALLARIGIGGQQQGEGGNDGEVGKSVRFAAGHESHRLWIDAHGRDARVMVASTPHRVEDYLRNLTPEQVTALRARPGYAGQLEQAIALAATVEVDSERVLTALSTQNQGAAATADQATENEEDRLVGLLRYIFENLGQPFGMEIETLRGRFDEIDARMLRTLSVANHASPRNMVHPEGSPQRQREGVVRGVEREVRVLNTRLDARRRDVAAIGSREELDIVRTDVNSLGAEVDAQWALVAPFAGEHDEAQRRVQEGGPERQALIDAVIAQVAAVRHEIVAEIPWARVMLRGSLIQGWRGPRKTEPEHGPWDARHAVRFDPGSFDADAFIEVPETIWRTELVATGVVRPSDRYLNVAEATGWARQPTLLAIEARVRAALGGIAGYRGARRAPDFHFSIEPTYWRDPATGRESGTQEFVAEGLVYPPRAFTGAAPSLPGLDRGGRRPRDGILPMGRETGRGNLPGVRTPVPVDEL